jgi:hypothetical protein
MAAKRLNSQTDADVIHIRGVPAQIAGEFSWIAGEQSQAWAINHLIDFYIGHGGPRAQFLLERRKRKETRRMG